MDGVSFFFYRANKITQGDSGGMEMLHWTLVLLSTVQINSILKCIRLAQIKLEGRLKN